MTTTRETTIAQRRILSAVMTYPQTPAEIKRLLPGAVPVATIRTVLGQLQDMGLVTTGHNPHHPGTTAWLRTSDGVTMGRQDVQDVAAVTDWSDVQRALSAMPYGAAVPVLPSQIISPERLIQYLDALADVLQGVAARADATEQELTELRSQRTAVRAFLGTAL